MMKMDKGNEFSNSGNFVGLSNRNRDSYQLLMDMDYDGNVSRSAEIFLDFAKCADKVFVKNGFGKDWVNDDPYVEPLENGAEFSFVKLTNENTGEKIEFVGKYVYGRFVNDDLSLSDFEYSGSFSVKYEGLSDESYQKLDGLLKSREFKNLYGMSYQEDAAWSSEINILMDGMSDVPSRDELLGKDSEMPVELDMSEINQKFKDRANGKNTGKGSR